MARQSFENGHFQRALKSCSGHFRLKILAASCSSHFFGQDKRTPGACRSISKTGEVFKVVRRHVTYNMASPVLLIERHTPGVRLSCPKKCEKQDAAKIFYLKYPKHEICREHFLSKQANFG